MLNKLSLIKSSFPKGISEAPKAEERFPLPSTIVHDEERNKLIVEVDLNALIVDPEKYVNLMYETTKVNGKTVKTDKVKGFTILAGLSKLEDFATVVRLGDSETGIRISKPYTGPSNLCFTVCDVETAERVQAANTKPAVRAATHEATA